ncbi:Helix-loop-helix DNA-binding domain protein [Ostertagia ostertagi]
MEDDDFQMTSPESGVRLSINMRERCRMHDLNEALDDLRAVLPYARGGSVRGVLTVRAIVTFLQMLLREIFSVHIDMGVKGSGPKTVLFVRIGILKLLVTLTDKNSDKS